MLKKKTENQQTAELEKLEDLSLSTNLFEE